MKPQCAPLPENEPRGLLTCDLVCWGCASPAVFSEYLDWLGKALGSRVVGFRHRAKDPAWDGTRPMALLEDGRRATGYEVGLWQRLWPGRLCRPSCYACGFHSTDRPGDLTIGDYWGLSGAHPGLSAGGGVSCLMANTRRGAGLLAAGGDALRLVPSEVALCANPSQPMLSRAPDPDGDKDDFWEVCSSGGFADAAAAVGALEGRTLLGLFKRAGKKAVRMLSRGTDAGGKDSAMPCGAGWEGAGMDENRFDAGGGYPLAFAAKNSSDEVRRMSASGGVFHALASTVIERGGVVYGCAFDESLAAEHIRCETMADVERCMGSKYSQSRMGDTIGRVRADLGAGRLVLFTGTPCQVAAVRRVCAPEAAGGGSLILADLICHGVPSPALFQLHLGYIAGLRKSPVASYEHRPKWNGWGHFEGFSLADGREERGTPLADSWRSLFYGNKMLRPSCCSCPFTTTRREGDLTIADFWGIENSSRPELKDALGVSLLLASTDEGSSFLSEVVTAGKLSVWPMSLAEALPGNPMLERPSRFEGDRAEPWEALYRDGYARLARKMGFHERELSCLARRVVSKAKRAAKRLVGRR